MSGTASARIAASSRSGRAKRGPSPSANESPSPIASGIGQDVGEEDRRVERKARERLQRHFGRAARDCCASAMKLPAFARVALYSGR